MDTNLPSLPSTIKLIFLDIFPSLTELSKSPDELTIIFQNLSQFYNLSELLSQKREITVPNCFNSLIITINKSNNIFATCSFNIKQGEQWITFGYETKNKKMTSNLALSLIDCIKMKINCEILTDDITNINSTITVNTVNSLANTINNLISNNINNNITSNNIINYNNNTININNSNLYNFKKKSFNNQINVPKKNNNKMNTKISPKKSTNDFFSKKSPKNKNTNFSNFTFTPMAVKESNNNNNNIKKKKLNPSTTINKNSVKKLELNSSNTNFNKTRNTNTSKRNNNNSLINSINDFNTLVNKEKNNQTFKKVNTSFGNLNALNHPRSRKSKMNFKQIECPEIEVKELHNYLKEPNAEGSPANKLILKKLCDNSFQANNYKSVCMNDKRENLLMSLDNLLVPVNKLNSINNNKKKKKKINNSNTCSNMAKKKISVKENNNKSNINDDNKVRLNTLNNYFGGNKDNKMENGDFNYLEGNDNNYNRKTVDKSIDINKKNNLMETASKNNFNDKRDLQITNSVKCLLNNNNDNKLKSDDLSKNEETKNLVELNKYLIEDNIEAEKDDEYKKDNYTENEKAEEELDDNFTRLKDDFILLYNEEYINSIEDDLLKLEIELLFEKLSELIYAYHSQMEEKQIENELLENNLKISIVDMKKCKKLFMNLEKIKFDIENNTKNNKKNVKKIKNLNVNINLNELKILQNIFLIKNNKTKTLKDIMMHILEKEKNRNILANNEKFIEWISICEKNQQEKLKIRNRIIPKKQQTQFAPNTMNNSLIKNNPSGNNLLKSNGSFYGKDNNAYRRKAIPPVSPICSFKGKYIPGTDAQPAKTLKQI